MRVRTGTGPEREKAPGPKAPMTPETKAALKENKERRRDEQRRRREANEVVDKITMDSRVEARTKLRQLKDRSGARSGEGEVLMRSRKKAKANNGPGQVFGQYAAASVLRFMGLHGYDYKAARGTLSQLHVRPMPDDHYIRHFLR